MKVGWLPREDGHWKLVVEPLNVLLTLKRVEGGYVAECLGQQCSIVTESERDAKGCAIGWFKGILSELEKELG